MNSDRAIEQPRKTTKASPVVASPGRGPVWPDLPALWAGAGLLPEMPPVGRLARPEQRVAAPFGLDDGVEQHQQTNPTSAVGSVPFVGFSFHGFFLYPVRDCACMQDVCVCVCVQVYLFVYLYIYKKVFVVYRWGLIGRGKSKNQRKRKWGRDRSMCARVALHTVFPFRPAGLCSSTFCVWSAVSAAFRRVSGVALP